MCLSAKQDMQVQVLTGAPFILYNECMATNQQLRVRANIQAQERIDLLSTGDEHTAYIASDGRLMLKTKDRVISVDDLVTRLERLEEILLEKIIFEDPIR